MNNTKNCAPKLIFWETTRACNLACPHCRASAVKKESPLDLTTEEAERFITQAAGFQKTILVFSGGEPLVRKDIYRLIKFSAEKGLVPAIATNAALITQDTAKKLKESGVKTAAVSVYGRDSLRHDAFCGQKGAFAQTTEGITNIRNEGIPFQINTTITKKNLREIEDIGRLAVRYGASAYHIFFLVPTGRGKSIEGDSISPAEYENVFKKLYTFQKAFPLPIKVTCAPHYNRVFIQEGGDTSGIGRGCLAGRGVCFVSHKGDVMGCGYLPITAGNLRIKDFRAIWYKSRLFKELRCGALLRGRCGVCEFRKVCGGCRARAYAKGGSYMDEEPFCVYIPAGRLLNRIQNNFPLEEKPYNTLGKELGISGEDAFSAVRRLVSEGMIRRIGAAFNSSALGYKSTLVALRADGKKREKVVSYINRHKGVTHNYLRNGYYNIWFTITCEHQEDIDKIISGVRTSFGINEILNLPVKRQFKIKGEFLNEHI